ncbi:hypothetical protein [Mycolicibacterium hippocampi]|uniref:Uncharacterized protein n=1 Tax=Mycolicibacterium hippocampi TaxID=659824 RepID=A0A7I9ZLL6_9MYCO|nr:hypothetical protein [Mycolicibacterium hippocampi]GFH01864.1 hypothetical protein MHIP_23470 [Mycolicibacterium hippocampi]
MRLKYLIAAPIAAAAGLFVAPTAAADCTTFGNESYCSFGGPGGTSPVLPYDCGDYDYYCNDGYQAWELF